VLEAGWSRVEFTPREPLPLAGYTHWSERLWERVRDPLFVRALAFRDGRRVAVLVVYDLLLVTEALHRGLVARLAPTGASVMVHATHTHSSIGGFLDGFLGQRFMGEFRPRVLPMLLDAGEQAVRQALAELAPADARSAAVTLPGLNGNRRDPEGPKDEELTVLRLVRRHDEAVVASYSAHPVIVAERDHSDVSADFPGRLCAELEKDVNFAAFVQGSLGGVDVLFPDSPGMTSDRNLALMAGPLASSAIVAARGARKSSNGLAFASRTWDLGRPDPRPFFDDQWQRRLDLPLRALAAALVWNSDRTARVQGIRVGDWAIVGAQADLGVGIGLSVKQAARAVGIPHPVAASQCDGYIGYVHLPQAYRASPPTSHRGMAVYENAMNFFGRSTGVKLLSESGAVVRDLANGD